MVTTIDDLKKRLEDDSETFTAQEVRTLLDWSVTHAANDVYTQARIASSLQHTQDMHDFSKNVIAQLLDRWETDTTPTLQVISYE